MLASFETIKASVETILEDIEKATNLKKKGVNIIWLSDDYCEDVDLFIQKKLLALETVGEYLKKNT